MKIEAAYLGFQLLVDRNSTNNNINVDKPRFIALFNSIQIKYVDWILDHRNTDKIRNISHLQVRDENLQGKLIKGNHVNFTLPANFYDLSNLQVFGSKGECKGVKLFTYEVKSEDTEELLRDVNMKPSFEYREVFYLLNGADAVSIFNDDFSIDKVLLTYYKYPRKVNIEGWTDEEGNATQNVDPEFDDRSTGYILEAMAKAFSANNSDGQAYQINKDRLFTNI